MVIGGLYRTVAEISFCRAVKRIVSASAPLTLMSATAEAVIPTLQSKGDSEKRSRDRKKAAGGKKEKRIVTTSLRTGLAMTPLRRNFSGAYAEAAGGRKWGIWVSLFNTFRGTMTAWNIRKGVSLLCWIFLTYSGR